MMGQVKVAHNNFDKILSDTLDGDCTLYISTMTKVTIIKAKNIKSFESKGYTLLSKANDGTGFLVQSGKRKDYVFAGMLIAQYE